MVGPKRRDSGTRWERLLKVLASEPDLSYDQLGQRGFPATMVARARKELGLGKLGCTPYVTRKEMAGKDVPGRAEPFNDEPGRYRQKKFKD